MSGVRSIVLLAVLAACGAPPSSEDSPTLRLELVGRFGSVGGPLALRHPVGITLSQGAGDTLYLNQWQVPTVLVLSANGDSLGAIGRSGAGPGEFTFPGRPFVHHDTIWVPNSPSGEVARFAPDGRFLDQMRPRIPPFGERPIPPTFVAPLADGTLLYRGMVASYGSRDFFPPDLAVLARVDRAGAILDTVATERFRAGFFRLAYGESGRFMVGRHPLSDEDRTGVDPYGRWIVVASPVPARTGGTVGLGVAWIGPRGDTLHTRHLDLPATPARPAREAWIDTIAERERHFGITRAQIASWATDQMTWPEALPPVRAVFADNSGRAWLHTPHAASDSARWLVFAEDGRTVGEIVLPRRVELLAARSDVVWGWTRGPYDEPYLLRYRIVR